MGKNFLTAGLTGLLAAAMLVSCADVPSTGPTPPDFVSEFRFVHAASDLGNVQVTVDGANAGSLEPGKSTGHATYPAGSRRVSVGSGDPQNVAMTTDQRGTFVIMPTVAGFREFMKLSERRIFDTPISNRARIVSAQPDNELTVAAISTTGDTVLAATSLSYKQNTGYFDAPAGDYRLEFRAGSGQNNTTTVSVSGSHTAILMGSGSAVSLIYLSD